MIAITQIRGNFHGIYEWGNGYVSMEMKRKWDEFWEVKLREHHPFFWKYIKGDDFSSGSLVSTYNAIYMHPMSINAVFSQGGGCSHKTFPDDEHKKDYRTYFTSEINELNKLCKACAEYCGGTFELFTTKEAEIDEPETNFKKFENEETYVKEMAAKVIEKKKPW